MRWIVFTISDGAGAGFASSNRCARSQMREKTCPMMCRLPAGMRVNVRTIMHYNLDCYVFLLRRLRRFGVPAA